MKPPSAAIKFVMAYGGFNSLSNHLPTHAAFAAAVNNTWWCCPGNGKEMVFDTDLSLVTEKVPQSIKVN